MTLPAGLRPRSRPHPDCTLCLGRGSFLMAMDGRGMYAPGPGPYLIRGCPKCQAANYPIPDDWGRPDPTEVGAALLGAMNGSSWS